MKKRRVQHVYEELGFKKVWVKMNSWKNQVGELSFNLKYYVGAYEDGVDYQKVVERAVADIEEHIDQVPEVDIAFIYTEFIV